MKKLFLIALCIPSLAMAQVQTSSTLTSPTTTLPTGTALRPTTATLPVATPTATPTSTPTPKPTPTPIPFAAIVGKAPVQTQFPYESPILLTPEKHPIDKLVFAKLKQLDIEPAHLSSDAAFIRRVYLDLIGTLPTADEAKKFLLDTNVDKRSKLIDQLLERDEFADYWTMKWADLLRVKAEFPVNLWPNAVQAYYRWIWTSIKQNKPYDQFARELLISNGSNFRVAPVNFLRAVPNKTPEGVAQMVALSLMGTRTETWPKDQAKNLAVFFSRVGYKSTLEWKEEIVYFDQTKSNGEVTIGTFPDGTTARLLPDRDPREAFADWLITPKNKWFTRNIANRAWSWFMGRGIIHEPDDIRPDNPAQNPELLALLEKEMVNSKYDMKKLFRFILNSQTYQLSCIPRSKKPEAEANFAEYPLRRLEAEVLIDALDNITSSTEKYSSPIPEPFTFVPEEKRSITLSDGSITSPFLEMFGRPARDTGWESERNNHPSADQRLHFLNSTHVQRKIEQSKKLKAILETYQKRPRDLVDQIYLTILSRLPSEEELRLVQLYTQNTPPAAKREAAVDLIWALINTDEFLYRH